MYDICIIGGGAAGMACGVTAAKRNKNLKICILEKKEEPGKKLLATGNGKCNMTNEEAEDKDDVLSFFSALGVVTRTDGEGRIYPHSEQGAQIAEILIRNIKALQVELRCSCQVSRVKQSSEEAFEIRCEDGKQLKAKKVLIAVGGKAGPQFGCTGDGYRWARDFGHKITKLAPALSALECEGDFQTLKGVRCKGEVYLFKDKDMIGREPGELQFTKDGLSGICIFNLSGDMEVEEEESFAEAMKRYYLSIDFVPEMGEEELIRIIKEKKKSAAENEETWQLLETIVNTNLAKVIAKKAGEDAHDLAAALKYWTVQVKGVKGWKDAQCTAGGVLLEEIHLETMESKLVKNLYFAGEILNYQGPCGGFNLNHAWNTGIKAGKAMADEVQNQ